MINNLLQLIIKRFKVHVFVFNCGTAKMFFTKKISVKKLKKYKYFKFEYFNYVYKINYTKNISMKTYMFNINYKLTVISKSYKK